MTRIIIEPFVEPTRSIQNEKDVIKFDKWNDIFQADFSNEFNVLCDGILNRCTNLTKCEIRGNETGQMEKFLVSLQPVKSPIQLMNTKESGTVSMRKFINSIESSYPADYSSLYDSNHVVYAMLDAINFKPDVSFSIHKNPVLKLSNFLQQKLGLFKLNPKVLVKAKATSLKECKVLLENTENKHINLKTNYSGENMDIRTFTKFLKTFCETQFSYYSGDTTTVFYYCCDKLSLRNFTKYKNRSRNLRIKN
ncbi:hypothetical protein BpHYR1_026589 [Brachionus plicatilis]|uniref:Uncharacterized protein n=1 Tax=Brachionus plicatilis TaxID=10195 RepID=A0A3M7P2R5_BRAPC|nr:hypothetical protein BpHYR1_026589 [Brachionus plicatilis]